MDILDRIARNLEHIGAVSLDRYLADFPAQLPQSVPPPPASAGEQSDAGPSPVAQLHHACQRTFRSTDPLKFEFIEHPGSQNKQCILTITKPDGVCRSYTTQPVFPKKNEAKLEAAKLAIEMGALDFLAGDACASASPDGAVASDAMSLHSAAASDSLVEDIEKSCLEWRAVTPRWVPFSDPKLVYKQGCALRIQLSPHVVRIYLVNPTFDTYLDAKNACASAAIHEGVLNFIKYGNGQSHPPPPIPTTSPSAAPPVNVTTPLTLQAFYDSLPRPFPESFNSNEASEINAPAWLNTMIQNARGGKLLLSFFFTSDNSPGLHGCLLKLDRLGEYKASFVDARFPRRSDAKAAVCLQAMSEGIGDYIRSISLAVDNKITHTMRSFSSSFVFPALMSELSKIGTDLSPSFEHEKERDAFGASLVVRLSTSPTAEQVRRYTVPSEYRNKADARVGVICHAAEQGVVEFVRFRGGNPPDGYTSSYNLHTYDPETSRKRKQSGSAEDTEQAPRAKKRKKRGKRKADVPAYDLGGHLTGVGLHTSVLPSSDQMHGISRPSDMGLSQSIHADDLCDPSRPGFGGVGGSVATRPVAYGQATSYSTMYGSGYPGMLDPRLAGRSGLQECALGGYPLGGGYGGGSLSGHAHLVDVSPAECGSSHPRLSDDPQPEAVRRPVDPVELEPGEVVSSDESEFSVSSSRDNEEGEVRAGEQSTVANSNEAAGDPSVDVECVVTVGSDKGKGKETSSSNTPSRDDPVTTTLTSDSHVKKLIEFCTQHDRGTPSFHETERQGRFQVWIVIGKERFDLPATYANAEEGRQRVAKQVLARLSKG